jgi:nucleotide-binding universal stress UspA family protein
MTHWPKRKVVVPVDFSDESIEAIDQALAIVDDPSHVHIVHVRTDVPFDEFGAPLLQVDREAQAEHALQALSERLSAPKYAAVARKVLFGDPGHEIAEFAAQTGAELIVLPSHGRRGLTRLLMGSVAERVVRLAHCPVLVLRK